MRCAVQVPVEVRMRPDELRARMYRRMQRMMGRETTGQGTDELARAVTTAAGAYDTSAATAARAAVGRREIRHRGWIWILLVAVLARHVRERPDPRLRGDGAARGRRGAGARR